MTENPQKYNPVVYEKKQQQQNKAIPVQLLPPTSSNGLTPYILVDVLPCVA